MRSEREARREQRWPNMEILCCTCGNSVYHALTLIRVVLTFIKVNVFVEACSHYPNKNVKSL